MKYKRLKLQLDIRLEGIPNKGSEYQTLYKAHLTDKPIWVVRKILDYLEEWYPENKKRVA
jgi:hypothetical protein